MESNTLLRSRKRKGKAEGLEHDLGPLQSKQACWQQIEHTIAKVYTRALQ